MDILTRPDSVPGKVTTGYQAQNEMLYAGNTGLKSIAFNAGYTYTQPGFVYECGSEIIKSKTAVTVEGIGSIPNNNFFYIYGNNERLYADMPAPQWKPELCGWYKEKDRALIRCVKTSGGIREVMFDDDFESLNIIIKPTGSGTLIKSVEGVVGRGDGNRTESLLLTRGWYSVRIGGGGGAGGHSWVIYNGGTVTPIGGGRGGDGGQFTKMFYVSYNDVEIIMQGGQGGEQRDEPDDNGYAGGESYIIISELSINFRAYGGGAGERGQSSTPKNGANGAAGGNNQNGTIGWGSSGGAGGVWGSNDGKGYDGLPGYAYLYKH